MKMLFFEKCIDDNTWNIKKNCIFALSISTSKLIKIT